MRRHLRLAVAGSCAALEMRWPMRISRDASDHDRDVHVQLSLARARAVEVDRAAGQTGDHVAKVVFGGYVPVVSELGRIAFPLFALVMACNLAQPGADLRKSMPARAGG